jgi:hypothetical protein
VLGDDRWTTRREEAVNLCITQNHRQSCQSIFRDSRNRGDQPWLAPAQKLLIAKEALQGIRDDLRSTRATAQRSSGNKTNQISWRNPAGINRPFAEFGGQKFSGVSPTIDARGFRKTACIAQVNIESLDGSLYGGRSRKGRRQHPSAATKHDKQVPEYGADRE